MSTYADSEFYKNEYAGTAIPDAELSKRLLRASLMIDQACRYRLGVLSDWPEFSQRQIRLATCAQADSEFKNGELKDVLSIVGSYSIGDVSVSAAQSEADQGSLSGHYGIDDSVLAYLLPTGLLNRRV